MPKHNQFVLPLNHHSTIELAKASSHQLATTNNRQKFIMPISMYISFFFFLLNDCNAHRVLKSNNKCAICAFAVANIGTFTMVCKTNATVYSKCLPAIKCILLWTVPVKLRSL